MKLKLVEIIAGTEVEFPTGTREKGESVGKKSEL